jgi:CspA family cold shock protein
VQDGPKAPELPDAVRHHEQPEGNSPEGPGPQAQSSLPSKIFKRLWCYQAIISRWYLSLDMLLEVISITPKLAILQVLNAAPRAYPFLSGPQRATQYGLTSLSTDDQARESDPFCPPNSFTTQDSRLFADTSYLTTGTTIMITGTVKFFNTDKGYGFIAPETGGDDAFVHISAVERAGMSTLNKDQRVSYELETDQRGKTSAVNLQAA